MNARQARSSERLQKLSGHWFWRGDPVPGSDMFPTFPMRPETCLYLDHAYAAYLEDGRTTASYTVDGARYEANFTTMTQVSGLAGVGRAGRWELGSPDIPPERDPWLP